MEKDLNVSFAKQRKIDCAFCFALASFAMLLLLLLTGFLPENGISLVKGDVMYNYIPAIRNLCRDIMNGENVFYTWTYGLGTNTSLFNAYYSLSPFNALYLIFYNADVNLITAVCIILKTGLSAMCFCYFMNRTYSIRGIWVTVFSVFYSLCSFQVAFNVHNIIWLDAMYVLPLVCCMIKRLLDNGEWFWLTVWYAYVFVSNFYMGYMVGIAGTVFLILCIFINKTEARKTATLFGKYFMAVILGAGGSAVVWLPAFLFIVENANVGVGTFSAISANLLDVFNQLFWGEVSDFSAIYPYIFCGTPVLLLTPSFFLDRKNSVRERIGYGVVIAILILSCMWLPLYALWHGFEDPDLYAYRFSYIISFFLCIIGVKETENISVKKGTAISIVAVELIIYLVEMFWQRKRIDVGLSSNSLFFLLINVILLTCWCFFYYFCYKKKGKKHICAAAMVFLAIIEMLGNGLVILKYKGNLSTDFSKEAFEAWNDCESIMNEYLSSDDDLFRVSYYQDMNPSSGTYFGFNSMSYFNSAENVNLRNTLSHLGMWTSPRMVSNIGLTPVTKMLLGVKYDAYNAIPVEGAENQYVISAQYNDYYLGMGFMVDKALKDWSADGENPFENTNSLLSAMEGREVSAYVPISEERLEVHTEGVEICNTSEGIEYSCVDSENVDGSFAEYRLVNQQGNSVYACFDNDESLIDPKAFKIKDDADSNMYTNGYLSVSFISELKNDDEGNSTLVVEPGAEGENTNVKGVCFYELNRNELGDSFENLGRNTLKIDDYGDGYISGTVYCDGTRNLLFTSVPYEKGWKVFVDGVEQKIVPVVDNSFIALEISAPGEHRIQLDFEADGETVGRYISAASIIVMLLFVLKRENEKKKNYSII